ncbi:MAG: glycerol kinase GlpK [Clostridia bacterium]|nr:glycerol kinase GlpK [Clostridia bacterium]
MKKYILALDQGTTSSRCIVYDKCGNKIGEAQRELPQIYPLSGWVEHDPEAIWSTQLHAIETAVKKAGIDPSEIAAIGITNQRETTVVWDKRTGKALCNAIVWQCRRTADYCEEIKNSGYEPILKEKTGLIADPYFSLTKVKYILDNVDGAKDLSEEGKVAFGTVDSWLIHKLTNGKCHATDASNASRTMMYNIHEGKWDSEILAHFGIPESILPTVVPSSGYIADAEILGTKIPICGVAGDQQASLFGQCCFKRGDAKNTYGTGCFLLMNTGDDAVLSERGLLTTVAWQMGDKLTYALEGSVFIAGAAIQWLRDGIGILASSSDSEKMALDIPNTDGVYFVPAFTGLGAPHWDPECRGLICGLSRGTDRRHIVRAALEAMAYQTDDVLTLMESESGTVIPALRVDGGASANGFLCSFQSDISDKPVIRPQNTETTSLGAAFLAGLGCGLYSSVEEISSLNVNSTVFEPKMSETDRVEYICGWKNAVKKTTLR